MLMLDFTGLPAGLIVRTLSLIFLAYKSMCVGTCLSWALSREGGLIKAMFCTFT